MSKIVLLIASLLIFMVCCKKDFTNKEYNEIKIGETIEFYYSFNSCCKNCFYESFKAIQLIEEKAEETPEDCVGCTIFFSKKFKGVALGTDTIKMTVIPPLQECTAYAADSIKKDIFIIHVIP